MTRKVSKIKLVGDFFFKKFLKMTREIFLYDISNTTKISDKRPFIIQDGNSARVLEIILTDNPGIYHTASDIPSWLLHTTIRKSPIGTSSENFGNFSSDFSRDTFTISFKNCPDDHPSILRERAVLPGFGPESSATISQAKLEDISLEFSLQWPNADFFRWFSKGFKKNTPGTLLTFQSDFFGKFSLIFKVAASRDLPKF